MVHFDLFVHEGQVWELANSGTDDEVERPYEGLWPVRAWFTSADCHDGDGWRRSKFEKHGRVLEDYVHDVGAGDQTQAVLVEVANAVDFVALVECFELEQEKPTPLYGD